MCVRLAVLLMVISPPWKSLSGARNVRRTKFKSKMGAFGNVLLQCGKFNVMPLRQAFIRRRAQLFLLYSLSNIDIVGFR